MDSAVLFVSPHLEDVQSLSQMLADASVGVVHAANLKDATKKLDAGWFPVVLTESTLEDGSWRDLLNLTRVTGSELVVTDLWADSRFWAEAINMGAYDLLAQPFQQTEVRRVIASASAQKGAAQKGKLIRAGGGA